MSNISIQYNRVYCCIVCNIQAKCHIFEPILICTLFNIKYNIGNYYCNISRNCIITYYICVIYIYLKIQNMLSYFILFAYIMLYDVK